MWMHYEDLNVYTVRKISSQLTCTAPIRPTRRKEKWCYNKTEPACTESI